MNLLSDSSLFRFPVLLGFLLISCKGKINPVSQKNPPVIVDALIASPKQIDNTLEANGTVIANEYVELHPEVSGRITYLDIPEGQYIKQGTLLARINDEDLEAQLDKSKVALDLAEKTVSRDKQLLEINGINQADYDAALNILQGYQADIAYEQALIDKTYIKAPFDGVVGLRKISPGAFVTPADIIATVQQLSTLKIDFTLPVTYSKFIRKGQLVDIEADGDAQAGDKAEIIAVEPQADVNTRNILVRALLQGTRLSAGSFVKILINAGRTDAIMVPTNALIPDDRNNQVVLVKKGMATFVNVKTGIREPDDVEITQGVQPGDTVIVSGVLFARPDHPVQVRSIRTLQELDSIGN